MSIHPIRPVCSKSFWGDFMKGLLKHIFVFALASILTAMSGCVDRFVGEETELYTGDPITPEEIDSIFDAISASVTEKYPIETDTDGDLVVYWLEGGSVWHSSSSCSTVSKADPGEVKSGKISDAIEKGKERACKVCSKDYADYTQPYVSYEVLTESDTNAVQTEYSEISNCEDDSVDVTITTIGQEATVQQETTVNQETIVTEATTDIQTIEETTAVTVKYPKEYDSSGSLIVYWLKSGSVWHESAQCGTIKKASQSNVYSGTPNDAWSEGKERACKVCSADSEVVIKITETTTESVITEIPAQVTKYPKEYDSNGELIVYWLKSGSVWHESAQCGTIRKATTSDIFFGTPSEAFNAGKERACKVCSPDSQVIINTQDITTTYIEEVTTAAHEKYPKEYDDHGNLVVFWLEGGSVWHESLYCSVLSDLSRDSIFSGSVFEAMLAHKERACKRCS